MAAGTLMVLDASLPAGVIEGTGTLRHGQTMVFTTLMLFQLFNGFSARSADRSAFEDAFTNPDCGQPWGCRSSCTQPSSMSLSCRRRSRPSA
jgi:hypothetical protein